MKAWRRGCTTTGGGGGSPPVAISAVVTDGSDVVVVYFDGSITWDGVDQGTLTIDGDPMQWSSQAAVDQLQASSFFGNPHAAGEPWTMNGPEIGLVPTPTLPESGNTT